MFSKDRSLKLLFTVITLFSVSFQALPVRANDIVGSEDVVSGSSVFVFRGSRKRPQESAGGSMGLSGQSRSAYRSSLGAQINANRKKKADDVKNRRAAVERQRARTRIANQKRSNTLASAAEKQMDAGDVNGAIVNYRAALKAYPRNVEAKNGLSEALTTSGIQTAGESYDEAAVPMLEEAVKLDPKNEVAFSKLGEIHDAKGRNAQALANYEKALAIDPNLSSLYYPVALAYVEAGNSVKADLYLTKAEASGINASDARLARGVVLMKDSKYPEALAIFDQVVVADRNNGSAHYYRAVTLNKMGRSDDSVKAYRAATQADPSNSKAWFDLGVIYYNSGDYKNALTAYQQSVKGDQGNAKAHANLASTYRQLERYPEANAEYKIAAETIKDDADLYSEWGFCLGKTKEWDKAVERLETARSLSPSAVDDTNLGWAYYNAAQADKAAGNEEEANVKLEKSKTSLQSAVKKDPNLDAAYLNLGSTHNSLGEHDEAVVALNNAVRLHDDWVLAINQLGLAYRGSNNLPMALNQFNRAVALDGNNVAGLFNLGSAQHASGDKKGAKKTQDRLKKLRPDLAEQLGSIIAGKLIDAGKQKLRQKIRIPGIPF